jgi:two-component system chemotaxis response regulator CheY
MSEPLLYKVLIADDHAMARQIVFNVMQELRVTEIRMASNGKEARDALYSAQDSGHPFDIVFLDWNMPLVEGIDILTHFRADPGYAYTAFIMLTAQGEQHEVLKAAKSGATSYIVKPASKEIISKKFFEAIEWIKKKKSAGHKPVSPKSR